MKPEISRAKQWVRATVAILVCALVLESIVGVLYWRNAEQFQTLEPGAWLTNSANFQFRLDDVEILDEALGNGIEANTPTVGASYLIAHLSVKAPEVIPDIFDCRLRLIGTEKREWSEKTMVGVGSLWSVCNSFAESEPKIAAIRPQMKATVCFELPTSLIPEVIGLAPYSEIGFSPTLIMPVQ